MQTNKVQFKLIDQVSEWNEIISNDQYIVHSVNFSELNPDMLQVFYSNAKESHFGGLNTNVALAAFVTCHARIHLYKELEKLGDRVLYFDTYSIIFSAKDGDYVPALGDYLGQFTNEINPKEGNYIDEFVSGGPKNYAFKLDTGVTHCTVRGFTLNHLASLKITFDSIKNIVRNDQQAKISTEQLKFITSKKTWSVMTKTEKKEYGMVYDKRILHEDLTTLPFGFN